MPAIEDFDDPAFDPYVADEAFLGDFPDYFQIIDSWRSQGAVLPGGYSQAIGVPEQLSATAFSPHFRVISYDAVHTVLTNPELFSNRAFEPVLGEAFGHNSLSVMDAPRHRKYRRIFQKAFLPNVVGDWGDAYVQPVIDELLGAFPSAGRFDLVSQFTRLYPFGVIFRMLRLPEQERPVFQKMMLAQILFAVEPTRAREATYKLGQYFSALIDERVASPGDDLVSALATAEFEGERLPQQNVIDFLRQLFNAGGDTTYRGTSSLLTAILTTPGLLETIRADRSLIPQAIEENLRWEPPVMSVDRLATQDTELGGVAIPEGSLLNVMIGAANHDPDVFDDPHAFNLHRTQQARHLAFAHGPHVCLGQHLARIEISRALNSLLDALPGLRLDEDYPRPQIMGSRLRGPRELRVRFDPA
ncbi:cytochrome P450 [Mycolicibacterium moriokaense]|uniref:cytochrome P450 n=1 Tax=Mycolicibacterium moriokaense TaxID=39691 RepID=UPI001C647894|nr:cytochrome P450 [Mycolicibacterium moriokaense]